MLAGSIMLAAALPAVAGAACVEGTTSHPFAGFGDTSNYVIAPGGTFESGAPGWTLSNASVGAGNEPFAATGTHSLAIAAGGQAVSPPICISSEYPSFRFFTRQLSGSTGGTLSASLRWVNLLGITVESSAGVVSSSGVWEPSPVMRLGNSVPLWLGASTLSVQLVFRSTAASSWAIDDVYVDPYSR